MSWRGARFAGFLLVVGLLATVASAQSGAPYRLHVNVRLLQIPTLVLSDSLQPIPLVKPDQFSIRLDRGPKFRPSDARLEGNDPLSVAVLLDLAGGETELIEAMDRDFAAWVKDSFQPNDRIAIYGLDCKLVHTRAYLPANSPLMQKAFDGVVQSPDVHDGRTHPACGRSVHLWDALTMISGDLATQPGRRVILAVSGGFDGHSTATLDDVRRMDVLESATIFGMSDVDNNLTYWSRDRFATLCQLTGGLTLISSREHLAQSLRHVMETLRGRYILEFTEPSNARPGVHSIDVRIDHMDAFIRTAGVSAVVDDPTVKDPDLIPRDTSKDPKMGNAREKDE